jgi:drug/metabolite transporter (DMT)-like permease
MASVHWIILAAGAPLLWAIVNHIDKYFLSDKFSHAKVGITGGLMIFSTLFSVVVIPILYFIGGNALFTVSWQIILTMITVGILNALAIYLYLHALDKDEASIVVPIFQTIPIFALVFGFILLRETLTIPQGIGALIVILASVLLTLELDIEKGVRIKIGVLVLMFFSSALYALGETIFKMAAIDSSFLLALFWENAGLLLFGLVLLCIKNYRKSFMSLVKNSAVKISALNLFSEGLTVGGNVLTRYALLLAPVALVTTVAGLQPLFVLMLGAAMTILTPHILQEKISGKHLVQKIVCITLIIIGTSVITFYS